MPRPRRAETPQQKRNRRARALGFENDYQRRVAGTRKGSAERASARGHGLPRAFLKSLGPGDSVLLADPVNVAAITYMGYTWRTRKGVRRRVKVERFRLIRKRIIYARSGRERVWNLRRLTRPELRALIRAEERKGVVFSPAPSFDQRRLLTEVSK